MAHLLNAFFLTLNAALAIPTAIYSVEVASGMLLRKRAGIQPGARRPQVAIVVPAHNEASVIGPTLAALHAQMQPDDRIVVVADNCDDATAQIAREAGAEVVERFNTELRGKGYALDAGISYLRDNNPPECVLIVDADCRLSAGSLDLLSKQVAETEKPAQAVYLMSAPEGAPLETHVAAFAYVIKCLARPLGVSRLGLPTQLLGTGMAFPWKALASVDLANGHLAEDLKLGLDLAQNGYAPYLCEDALVTSEFPISKEGLQAQRSRWENGHLSMVWSAMKMLFRPGGMRRPGAVVLGLDMIVPPLSLLLLLLMASSFATILVALILGDVGGLEFTLLNLALFGTASFAGWLRYGRDILPASDFVHIASYAFSKVPLYVNKLILRRKHTGWVRTERDQTESTSELRS
ncbi:glycosyltransferase [Aureimonas fodinaquatilis]|uniref:Glycosyltransferase n=1 Tax=Aureimonas fodinaquatilis TaxID=2565783 RepID=A0A5B0DYE6_9HYPH|nr:glycosyltransferase family 2 protein [Aureimonas fodinaquatilis]KAA0970580.1 glycosyltransferase [Aureimonas fodinaquatilis]